MAELPWEPVLWAACGLSFGVPSKPVAGVAVLSQRCCIAVWSSRQGGTGKLFLAETCPVPESRCWSGSALLPGSLLEEAARRPWRPACICLPSCIADALGWVASGQQGWLSVSSGGAGDGFQPADDRSVFLLVLPSGCHLGEGAEV